MRQLQNRRRRCRPKVLTWTSGHDMARSTLAMLTTPCRPHAGPLILSHPRRHPAVRTIPAHFTKLNPSQSPASVKTVGRIERKPLNPRSVG